jgi:glycosyltransferase involved in cell wall biosynthesis
MFDVSVLTPSYQYGHFIEDAIRSVLDQSGPSVQLVVQDGGSSDETTGVLSSYGDRVDWVSEPDRGQSDALNRALARAEGRWVAWLNADEFYLPDALARLVREGERSGADLVYGDCVVVDEAGRLVRLLPQHRFSTRVLREYGCYIASSAALFRRSALGEAPWDEGITRIMDWDLYMQLVSRGARFEFVPWPIGAFRVHPSQVTAAPDRAFDAENAAVGTRYGRSPDPATRWRAARTGRTLHRLYKVLDGAYARQWRGRPLRGADLRWFRSELGHRSFRRLVGRCYGRR